MALAAVSTKHPHQVYLIVLRRTVNKALIQIVYFIHKRQIATSEKRWFNDKKTTDRHPVGVASEDPDCAWARRAVYQLPTRDRENDPQSRPTFAPCLMQAFMQYDYYCNKFATAAFAEYHLQRKSAIVPPHG
jgi:hypothetical protein